MGQIIRLSEIQAARERSQRQARDRESLERAVAFLKESLAGAAERLRGAPASEQSELLERIERLTALVRYSLRMLGEIAGGDPADAIVWIHPEPPA